MSDRRMQVYKAKYLGRRVIFTFKPVDDGYKLSIEGSFSPVELNTFKKAANTINEVMGRYSLTEKTKIIAALRRIPAVDHRIVAFIIEFIRKRWPHR